MSLGNLCVGYARKISSIREPLKIISVQYTYKAAPFHATTVFLRLRHQYKEIHTSIENILKPIE